MPQPETSPKQRAQYLRAALVSHRRVDSPPEWPILGDRSLLHGYLEELAVDPEAQQIVLECVFNENLRITEPSRQRRDALIVLMSEHPELFDASRIGDTMRAVVESLAFAAARAASGALRVEELDRQSRRRITEVVGSRSDIRAAIVPALMARAIRSPKLTDEELFADAVRSMLVRSAVRRECIHNGEVISRGSADEIRVADSDAWWSASMALSNEYHRIEPFEEPGDADISPGERSALEEAASAAIGPHDAAEALLLTAVCRYALRARNNSRTSGLRRELKRRAMMEEQSISDLGEPEMTGSTADVEALAMEESILASALGELRRDEDSLSADAAAALEMVHRVMVEERSSGSSHSQGSGLEDLLGWFETNYPPLAGNYGGHASLHWSLAQIIRPHHVIWPSVGGPGPRARKFVSRLKARFGDFNLDSGR